MMATNPETGEFMPLCCTVTCVPVRLLSCLALRSFVFRMIATNPENREFVALSCIVACVTMQDSAMNIALIFKSYLIV